MGAPYIYIYIYIYIYDISRLRVKRRYMSLKQMLPTARSPNRSQRNDVLLLPKKPIFATKVFVMCKVMVCRVSVGGACGFSRFVM